MLARTHPVPVNGAKAISALRHIMRVGPEVLPHAVGANLLAQQAAWLAAHEREVQQRVDEGAEAARAEEEARKQRRRWWLPPKARGS